MTDTPTGPTPDAARGESLSELERAVVEAACEKALLHREMDRLSWMDGPVLRLYPEWNRLVLQEKQAIDALLAARAAASAAQGEGR